VKPVVLDPWQGWQEEIAGADRRAPYFGPGHYGVFTLDLVLFEKGVGTASFDWIGSYYERAPEATEKWWKRLRAWFKKVGIEVGGAEPSPNGENVWALPGAQELLTE
jgi:hypothetical protein